MTQQTGQTGVAARLSGGPAQVALWLVVVLLAVNAAILLLQPNGGPAYAQTSIGAAAGRVDNGGVFVVPAQISKDLYGAYLVDSRSGSVVVYTFNPNSNKLKLAAARTFVYDRYLEDYNTDPSPAMIADMVSKAKPIRPGGSDEKPDDKDKGKTPP
ncbi:MAG: hypothetical protein PHU85_08770 [Phycisphaerae bacterium]|nr:hypothetical protein [Phycisphaerae bacterium]